MIKHSLCLGGGQGGHQITLYIMFARYDLKQHIVIHIYIYVYTSTFFSISSFQISLERPHLLYIYIGASIQKKFHATAFMFKDSWHAYTDSHGVFIKG